MTLKEFREKVAESQHKDSLKDLSVSIPFTHLDSQVEKTGITDIYRFFKNQDDHWKSIEIELPGVLKKSKDHYSNCVKKIEGFLSTIENRNSLGQEWNELKKYLTKIQPDGNVRILTADSPMLLFLLDVHEKYPSSFNGAYDYSVWKRVESGKLNKSSGQSGDYLRGLNLAYEFELQDQTEILQRRSNEKKSLGLLRSNFENYLSEVETNTADYLKRAKDNFDTHSDEIVDIKEEKKTDFDTWFSNTKESFNTFDEESQTKIQELEKLYTEKLRLDAPVDYWSKRALWMNIFSGVSISLLIGIVGAGVWILYSLLTEDLEIYNVESIFGDSGALKWSIIYITLFSFLAYLVRTLGKVSFSFLHLARDAEERKQLTHVYLALSEESEMSKEDREIVLQSIFSRADTGLLKGDSSPTMPGIILEKFTGRGQ